MIFLIFLIFLINPGPERAGRRIAQKRSTALGSGAIPEIPSTMERSASAHSRRFCEKESVVGAKLAEQPMQKTQAFQTDRPVGHLDILIFLIFLINPGPERASRRIAQKRSTALGSGAIPEIPSTMGRSASAHSRRFCGKNQLSGRNSPNSRCKDPGLSD